MKPKQMFLPLRVNPLSPREQQVMFNRSLGLPYKQIGAELGISEHTVKHHVTRSLRKLGATCSLQAVRTLSLTGCLR